MKPAEMVAQIEKAAELDGCMKYRKTCDDLFGKGQKTK
jgi:hypothetical protein